ncbi:cysteinyl leukotriene receptor 2 [Colossoma macropomum]|uniref:cysteinyl leukotriene receptor 2 n=1 Tax=Colossoma macropomum TaxID=42526 RepID=UPI001864B80B|nr:cysteinyl leukotriene receptor 2 [Colossoma macropomum]XP_036444437.1 cysteinyl leukotriene receptor 2 [Colossoma macropomum]
MNSSCNCTIDDFKRSVFPAVYLLIFILGIAGHSVSIYVFFRVWKKKRSLTSVNLFMVNLLVSDLMQVCSLPFRAFYFLSNSHWPFGNVACRLIFYVFYLNMYSSIYFLVALNIMRYLALVHPYRFLRLQSCCRGPLVCCLIWLFVALASSPLLLASTKKGAEKCLELTSGNATVIRTLIIINDATLAVGFVLPLAIILWCSVFVVHRLLKPSPVHRTVQTSRKKACALVIISLGFYLICFLPYHIVRTLFLHAELDVANNKGCENSCEFIQGMRKAAVVSLCLGTANSCLDPILFFFVGENFRTFFAKMLRREKADTDNRRRSQQRAELQVLSS